MPERDDAIDAQIKRLEDYLLGNKQIVNAHEITIEQALALAYIARELQRANDQPL
jgi:phosphate uptake regulator